MQGGVRDPFEIDSQTFSSLISSYYYAHAHFQVRKGVHAGGMFPAASLESGERLQFNFGVTPFAHPPPSPFVAVSKAFGVGGVEAALAEAEEKATLAIEQSVDASPETASEAQSATTTNTETVSKPEPEEKAPVLPAPNTKAEASAADKPVFTALDLSVVKSAEDLLRACYAP